MAVSIQLSDTAQNKECTHPVEKCRFLCNHLSPHFSEPDLKAIMSCIFLCETCGKIFAANLEVVKPLLLDGAVPPEVKKYIDAIETKRREDIRVEMRAKQLLAQKEQAEKDSHGKTN